MKRTHDWLANSRQYSLGLEGRADPVPHLITLGIKKHAELRKKHIDVLAVLAGPIDTDMVKDLAMPKTSPADTARGLLAGIARGDEEIFPDPMAQEMSALWNKSHEEYERAFASF